MSKKKKRDAIQEGDKKIKEEEQESNATGSCGNKSCGVRRKGGVCRCNNKSDDRCDSKGHNGRNSGRSGNNSKCNNNNSGNNDRRGCRDRNVRGCGRGRSRNFDDDKFIKFRDPYNQQRGYWERNWSYVNEGMISSQQTQRPPQQETHNSNMTGPPCTERVNDTHPISYDAPPNMCISENTNTAEINYTTNIAAAPPVENNAQLRNIKLEKTESENNQIVKQVAPSSSFTSREQQKDTKQSIFEEPKDFSKDQSVKQCKLEPVVVRPNKKSVSSSSSTEETSSSEEDPITAKQVLLPKKSSVTDRQTPLKTGNESKRVQSGEEDVVCLGKLENKFLIEDDDDSESTSEHEDKKSKKNEKRNIKYENICVLCDKKGHNSFECQMVCKNCQQPYHNLRNCPKPPNLSIMMQTFMQFCMQQMDKFNPEANFSFVQTLPQSLPFNSAFVDTLAMKHHASLASYSHRKSKSSRIKESSHKKSVKKRRLEESDDGDCNDGQYKDDTSSADSSKSSSSATNANKPKKKRSKQAKSQETTYLNPYAASFATLPSFGSHSASAAAAFNPLLPIFSSMMQSGFPPNPALNFKR